MPSAMMSKPAKQFERIFAAEPGFELTDVQKRIDRLQLLGRRIQFFAAHVGRAVNNLPLQVRVIHHVEVHDSKCAHACRAQIQCQRRTQARRLRYTARRAALSFCVPPCRLPA